MGYELNKLMKQYGVATPGAVNYSGPAAPGAAPTPPELIVPLEGKNGVTKALSKAQIKSNQEATDKYNADKAAFDEAMRKYGLGQKEYNQYRTDYMGRIGATPMYSDAQYQTGPSAGMAYATRSGGIGADQYNTNITDWLAKNPNTTAQNMRNEMDKYGISAYDVAQARGTPGSMWGNTTVSAPTYGAVPATLAAKTEQDKVDYYKRLRDLGYTDADIRGETTKSFGTINETDWRNLLNKAYPTYQPMVEAGYANLGRSGYGSAVNQIDEPGYNYWLNQLSSGKVKPEDLNTAMYGAANTWMPTQTFDQAAIPQQFDWGYYVGNNPDLKAAGIDTLQEAQRHYAMYGAKEGRSPYEGWVNPNPAPAIVNSPTPIIREDYSNNFVSDGFAHGGSVNKLAAKYKLGGEVRKFKIGGDEGEPVDQIEALIRERSPSMGGEPPIVLANAPTTTATDAAPVTASSAVQPVTDSPAAKPVTPPPSATTPVSPAANDLMSMMSKYLGAESTYGPELAAARKRVTAENAAFQDMIANAMKPDGAAPDKAEMYFRLAAAFGAPTKTGHFTENLAMVGKELGDYAKDVRAAKKADKQLRMQLGIEAQKLKTQAARDELTTLRTLAGEEMKDKRAIVQEYLKSGRPQSEAGKAAIDAGLTQGTPEFTAFVNKYLDDKIRSGNIVKEAMVAIAAGNLAVSQSREKRTAESAAKLTPKEVELKSQAETTLGGLTDAMDSLKRAYSLNPNTFEGTWTSIAQQKILEQTDPKDPRVLATREQRNLLGKGAIERLKAAFGGNPTEGERAALLELEGLDAKSKEERARIMKNTYKLLQARHAREKKRLDDINAGRYRETTPEAGGIE